MSAGGARGTARPAPATPSRRARHAPPCPPRPGAPASRPRRSLARGTSPACAAAAPRARAGPAGGRRRRPAATRVFPARSTACALPGRDRYGRRPAERVASGPNDHPREYPGPHERYRHQCREPLAAGNAGPRRLDAHRARRRPEEILHGLDRQPCQRAAGPLGQAPAAEIPRARAPRRHGRERRAVALLRRLPAGPHPDHELRGRGLGALAGGRRPRGAHPRQ